jgi:hypothetical protein
MIDNLLVTFVGISLGSISIAFVLQLIKTFLM